MSERLVTALRRRPGRLFCALLVGFAGLAACDAYFAFTKQPYAPGLAPWVDLTGPRGLSALAGVGLILLAGLITLSGLRRLPRDRLDAARAVSILGPAGLLFMLGALDVSRLKPSVAGDMVLLAPAAGVLLFGILRGLHWPLPARLYATAGLLLLATNPVTDRLERWLAGNSDYYAFDAARQTYVFDQQAWRALWAVSRAQELSELCALACLLMALLYIATAHAGQSGAPAAGALREPGAAEHAAATGVRQQ